MSRSCQRATFSSPTSALARSTRARPQMRSHTIGFRLCGIADDPFWPAANGSNASRTSVRCRWRISSREPVERRRRRRRSRDRSAACRSRATTWVATSSRSRPAPGGPTPRRGDRCWRRRPRRPTACRRGRRRAPASSRARPRRSSIGQPSSFSPNVVGSACTPWVRPIVGVWRCSSARARSAASTASMPSSRSRPASRELERQRRVDDVGRREAVVEPARRARPDLLGDRLGEREHVVVGAVLDLADPGDVDARPLAHGRDRVGRHDAQLGPARHRRDLNVQPPGEPALVRPDGAHGGTGIAGDQSGPILSRREEVTRRPRLVGHLIVSRRSTQMSRITRIVPTTVLTVAALALVAPAAQAKPLTSGARTAARAARPAARTTSSPIVRVDPGRARVTRRSAPLSSRPATSRSRTR